MVEETFNIRLKRAKGLRDFASPTGRNYGMLYFQKIPERKKFMIRVITKETKLPWINAQLAKGNLYLPEDKITVEKS